MDFKLKSEYKPTGDQPQAIDTLVKSIENGNKEQTLLGVTGSGKTFTMANVIEKVNRPTLILAHNKTLAAQLCSEFKEFFPDNAVEYFVSYYDYYQPEAYVPSTDTYIEKDSSINDEIDKLRHQFGRKPDKRHQRQDKRHRPQFSREQDKRGKALYGRKQDRRHRPAYRRYPDFPYAERRCRRRVGRQRKFPLRTTPRRLRQPDKRYRAERRIPRRRAEWRIRRCRAGHQTRPRRAERQIRQRRAERRDRRYWAEQRIRRHKAERPSRRCKPQAEQPLKRLRSPHRQDPQYRPYRLRHGVRSYRALRSRNCSPRRAAIPTKSFRTANRPTKPKPQPSIRSAPKSWSTPAAGY